jgi:hypothetical protein
MATTRLGLTFFASAADGKNQNCITFCGLAHLEPVSKNPIPAFVVGPGSQLRDVINRRIRLDADEFPKVVHRMTAIPGAATHAEQEQAATFLSKPDKSKNKAVNGIKIQSAGNLLYFGKILTDPGVAHDSRATMRANELIKFS